ncbi:MAG: hypothetical protein LBT01_03190 [Spirochaetaceae bacterium]|nr:hypothetical protein [Spirochaetaceae bacterium]
MGILEILIAFFLFVPLTQVYIKSFYYIEGFAWLPPIALFCTVGLFPAYGFRPEAIPLLIFAFIYNISYFKTRKIKSGRSYFYFSIMLIFIALTTFAAIYFLPLADTSAWVYTQAHGERDSERNNDYFIRVYNTKEGTPGSNVLAEGMPLIIAIPPITGSTLIIDRVCEAIAARNVIVVSIARVNLDLPAHDVEGKSVYPSFGTIKNHAVMLWTALKNKNWETVRDFFEQARADDIAFLLPLIEKKIDTNDIYLLVYNEAATAATAFARDEAFTSAHPALRGIIAVEARQLPAESAPPAVPVLSLNAGGLMYTDVPEKYPIFAALARGLEQSKPPGWESKYCVPNTAALIYDFMQVPEALP